MWPKTRQARSGRLWSVWVDRGFGESVAEDVVDVVGALIFDLRVCDELLEYGRNACAVCFGQEFDAVVEEACEFFEVVSLQEEMGEAGEGLGLKIRTLIKKVVDYAHNLICMWVVREA